MFAVYHQIVCVKSEQYEKRTILEANNIRSEQYQIHPCTLQHSNVHYVSYMLCDIIGRSYSLVSTPFVHATDYMTVQMLYLWFAGSAIHHFQRFNAESSFVQLLADLQVF